MNRIQIPAIWSERILQIPYITAAHTDLKIKSKNTIKIQNKRNGLILIFKTSEKFEILG